MLETWSHWIYIFRVLFRPSFAFWPTSSWSYDHQYYYTTLMVWREMPHDEILHFPLSSVIANDRQNQRKSKGEHETVSLKRQYEWNRIEESALSVDFWNSHDRTKSFYLSFFSRWIFPKEENFKLPHTFWQMHQSYQTRSQSLQKGQMRQRRELKNRIFLIRLIHVANLKIETYFENVLLGYFLQFAIVLL